jgi:hypothetical protein
MVVGVTGVCGIGIRGTSQCFRSCFYFAISLSSADSAAAVGSRRAYICRVALTRDGCLGRFHRKVPLRSWFEIRQIYLACLDIMANSQTGDLV